VEIPDSEDYNIFTALLETINNQDQRKLRFAKCRKCGRLTPFRLRSMSNVTVKCKECGNSVPIKAEPPSEKEKQPKILSI
jgi:translation initiation factor 2 beta subunit (eIF-2beta)/eIF-5